ncbi:hypothetical protein PAXRUDRAFT_72807, partial [Paxillus rubicundulus Ve08.2h10]
SVFDQVTKLFTDEVNSLVSSAKLAGPGSEHVNAAISQASSGNKMVVTNPATGIWIHKFNTKGEKCVNKACADLPHTGNHDLEHCYYPRGGMEGQGPYWSRGRSLKTKEVSVAAVVPSQNTVTTPTTAFAATHHRDLSCTAVIETNDESEELALLVAGQSLDTILDSGTTLHLIMNQEYFWNYTHKSSMCVKTANHGMLPTRGRGDCIADLIIRGGTHCLMFHNCLHAPEAMINLLSIGQMLNKGWDCNFKGSNESTGPFCQLVHKGRALVQIPMTGNLCFMNLKFIHPDSIVMPILMEISAFAPVPSMWDLWH